MRILDHGNTNPAPKNWWMGLVIQCKRCACVYQLNNISDVALADSYSRNNEYMDTRCPKCNSFFGRWYDEEVAGNHHILKSKKRKRWWQL